MSFNKWVCENYGVDNNGDVKLPSFIVQSILKILVLLIAVIICIAMIILFLELCINSVTNVGCLIDDQRDLTTTLIGLFIILFATAAVYFISNIKIPHCKVTEKNEDEGVLAFGVCVMLFLLTMLSSGYDLLIGDIMISNGVLTLLFGLSLGLIMEDIINSEDKKEAEEQEQVGIQEDEE